MAGPGLPVLENDTFKLFEGGFRRNGFKRVEDDVPRDDNPLDISCDFNTLCDACRRNDLKLCQEMITKGVNINAKDNNDYTPLILASLCGHFETVRLLLESGALCERDTFQGERCLYNALNDKIRNLLLSYDYSKSTNARQPLAAHVASLLSKQQLIAADIIVTNGKNESFHLHKFILSARSPYFASKLAKAPETRMWKLPPKIPPPSFEIALRYLYLLELPRDLGGAESGFTDSEILAGLEKISKHLNIEDLSQLMLDRLSEHRGTWRKTADELAKGQDQLETWFRENVLGQKFTELTQRVKEIEWGRVNDVFADVLLQAEENQDSEEDEEDDEATNEADVEDVSIIPVGPTDQRLRPPSRERKITTSVLYPCHRAMLMRCEWFATMFTSPFREAQETSTIPVISISCSPAVLEIILTYLYTEKADFGLELAVDVLWAADMLFIEKLKAKAALIISALGNGNATALHSTVAQPDNVNNNDEEEYLDIYGILRAAWDTRVQRLEDFAARYIANRLEWYIDDEEFATIIKESANRISARQATDSIELLDDIRYHLSERFRLRFEDTGFEEVEAAEELAAQVAAGEKARAANAAALPPALENPERKDLPSWGSADMPLPEKEVEEDFLDVNIERNLDDLGTAESGAMLLQAGVIRTLDGEIAGDEFTAEAVNYQILLRKIDELLEKLRLDA